MPLHKYPKIPYYYTKPNNYYNPIPAKPSIPNSPQSQNPQKKQDFPNPQPQKKDPDKKSESSNNFFEFFGLKLYFDDILIICILYFLYKENVKDTSLFLCLIMLLLS